MNTILARLTDGRPEVTDEDGTVRPANDRELFGWGIKVVGSIDGDELVHATSTDRLPERVEILRGDGAPWEWVDLKNDLPDVASEVLHAVWKAGTDEDGNPVYRRGPQGPARGRGDIPTSVAEDLPPHVWSGDD